MELRVGRCGTLVVEIFKQLLDDILMICQDEMDYVKLFNKII